MSFPLRFTVEGPPVGKERARCGRGGHWYTPERTRLYAQKVAAEFLRTFRRRLEPPAVSLSIVCYFASARQPDCDNVLKLVADALQGLAYPNDRGIAMSVVPARDNTRPRIEVTLS